MTSISSNAYPAREYKLDLVYNKTYEEEMEEKRKLELAINYLEGFGIEVVSEYGHYRNIYNVLKDLGEYLDKPCVKCYHHNWGMPQCRECGPCNNYKYFVGSEI